MFGAYTIQLECGVPSQCEGTNLSVQERPKAIWLRFFLGLVFHGAHPSDAASDRIGGSTSR
jgi:hypothetical protein